MSSTCEVFIQVSGIPPKLGLLLLFLFSEMYFETVSNILQTLAKLVCMYWEKHFNLKLAVLPWYFFLIFAPDLVIKLSNFRKPLQGYFLRQRTCLAYEKVKYFANSCFQKTHIALQRQ